jgi:hypothetical protein
MLLVLKDAPMPANPYIVMAMLGVFGLVLASPVLISDFLEYRRRRRRK